MLAHPHQDLGSEDYVCHTCDNPICCRIDHLWIGTAAQNSQDRDRKGRARDSRGEKQGATKLTESQVREILASNDIARRLAPRFGISEQSIWDIRQRRTWKHVKVDTSNAAWKDRPIERGAKLNPAKVREIRASSEIARVLAGHYGVSLRTIYQIKHGHTWTRIK